LSENGKECVWQRGLSTETGPALTRKGGWVGQVGASGSLYSEGGRDIRRVTDGQVGRGFFDFNYASMHIIR